MLKQILSQIANQTYIIKDNQKRPLIFAASLCHRFGQLTLVGWSYSSHERHADWPRAATAFHVAECDLGARSLAAEHAEEGRERSDCAAN